MGGGGAEVSPYTARVRYRCCVQRRRYLRLHIAKPLRQRHILRLQPRSLARGAARYGGAGRLVLFGLDARLVGLLELLLALGQLFRQALHILVLVQQQFLKVVVLLRHLLHLLLQPHLLQHQLRAIGVGELKLFGQFALRERGKGRGVEYMWGLNSTMRGTECWIGHTTFLYI